MPRAGWRSKAPKGSRDKQELADATPSDVLSAVLKTLSLSFERDIGMLHGDSVRSLPNGATLSEFQQQLQNLDKLLKEISDSDQLYIDRIKKIRDERRQKELDKSVATVEEKTLKEYAADEAGASSAQLETTDTKIEIKQEESLYSSNGNDKEVVRLSKQQNSTGDSLASKGSGGDIEMSTTSEKENTARIQDREGESSESPTFGPNRKRHLPINDDEEEADNILASNDQKATSTAVQEKSPSTRDSQDDNDDTSLERPVKRQKLDGVTSFDVDRIENDPLVRNPKSEFVLSQTLPKAAAALGLYQEEGLESTGEEYLKKKYSVASYPTNDLKEYLPGELPDMDFSCPKPLNQIQYNTFMSFVDNFFRDITEEDSKLLQTKYILPPSLETDKTYDPETTPYSIPKLGPLYTETWYREDLDEYKRMLGKNTDNTHHSNFGPPQKLPYPPQPRHDQSTVVPKKSPKDIDDSALEMDDVSLGPLTSRLLSAILKDRGPEDDTEVHTGPTVKEEANTPMSPNNALLSDVISHESLSSAQTPMSDISNSGKLADEGYHVGPGTTSLLKVDLRWMLDSVDLDYPTLEEKLKRELKYVGIYPNTPKNGSNSNNNGGARAEDPDWLNSREDDEICAELRELQNTLREVTVKNQKYKEVLRPLVDRYMAWQEYSSILDDLDKQVDQAYVKRTRVPKKRKKHHYSSSTSSGNSSQIAQQKAANSNLKSLLEKRQRWINKIGPLFGPPELMKRIPKKSIFNEMDQEEDEDEPDVFENIHDTRYDGIET